MNSTSIYSYKNQNANYTANIINNKTENISSESANKVSDLTNNSDSIDISKQSYNSGFFKIVHESSAENGLMQGENCNISYSEAFFVARLIMESHGYNVPSIDDNYSNYSDFIDQMKNFFSNESDSFSNGVCNFCDILKNKLKQYGIN